MGKWRVQRIFRIISGTIKKKQLALDVQKKKKKEMIGYFNSIMWNLLLLKYELLHEYYTIIFSLSDKRKFICLLETIY